MFALALVLGVSARGAPASATSTVTLHHHGQVNVAGASADTLRNLALKFLESSNFNTVAHTRILGQSVPAVQERYRRAVAGDCLVITYDHPIKVHTVGGDVSAFEIVIGLNRPEYADDLFTIDELGRVVGHGKYSGGIGIELRRAANGPG
jgi:hypothetical protein